MKKIIFLLFISVILLVSCNKNKTSQSEKDKLLIEQFIVEKNWYASSTSEGIYYIIDDEGTGNHPDINSKVEVYYKGYLLDGFVFDSRLNGAPLSFYLTQVIKGWQIGIPLFKSGGKGKLIIPSQYGYGNRANGPIPANSVLVFEIELVSFQ